MATTPSHIVNVEEIIAKASPVPEVIRVSTHNVMCNGGGGALGHPKVWYTLGDEGYAECGYCDRLFVYDPENAGK